MKSNFTKDLMREQKLCKLLDHLYDTHLKKYNAIRIKDTKQQLQGLDVLFQRKDTGERFRIDEKAQLDYPGRNLPTFAFEIYYSKNEVLKRGWLFDPNKTTDFYALITNITQSKGEYKSCTIQFVNRKKLLFWLTNKGVSEDVLKEKAALHKHFTGKVELAQLNIETEGYLYFTGKRKAEKPVNLVLYLSTLERLGIAKRFI